MTKTIEIDEMAELAELVSKANQARTQDPRPKLGLEILAQAERRRAIGLTARLAESPSNEYAPAWAAYARVAEKAAQVMQAMADDIPAPPAPQQGREHPLHEWGRWKDVEHGRAEPGEYELHMIEAMAEAKAAGLSYNRDTGPRAAALMAARWGYPDAREGAPDGSDFGTLRHFGSHCYSAGCVLTARARRDANKRAAGQLSIGPMPGRLITTNGEHITSVVVVRIGEAGESVEIKGRRGRSHVTWTATATQAVAAMQAGLAWQETHGRKAGAQAPAQQSSLI